MSIQSEITRISGNVSGALSAIANKGVTVPAGSNSDDLADLIVQIPSGGGGTVRTTTGTFTGDNTTSVSISCDFSPDLIYVYGDMSASVGDRGVVAITIVKDITILHTSDTSTSVVNESVTYAATHGVSGYVKDATECRAEYSNGTLTIITGASSSSNRFASGITYSYKLMTWTAGGATQHTIHLEFSDSTDADIEVDYADSWVGSLITSTEPTTYGQKTTVEAQLDGTTWYEYTPIPIGVELVDYTAVLADMAIVSDGSAVAQEWYYASDYTAIDPSMSFSYRASTWFYIGFYASDYTVISTLYAYTDGTQDPSDSNTVYGTLTGKIPSNAAYVRVCGTWYDSAHMSLIRTA